MGNKFNFMYILLVSVVLLTVWGCDKTIPVSEIRRSPWVKKQIELVKEYNAKPLLLDSKELWLGKISSFDQFNKKDVFITPSVRLKSARSWFSKSFSEPVRLNFGDRDTHRLKTGDIIISVVTRGLKGQLFVNDWRNITDLPKIDPAFLDTYEYFLAIEIERNLCFNYRNIVLADGVKGLVISHGKKNPVKIHSKQADGSWSQNPNTESDEYSKNDFELILYDDGGKQSVTEINNTQDGIEQKGRYGRFSYILKCGYDFSPLLFSSLTFGTPAPVILPYTLRFSPILESAGIIARHPTTLARRRELQDAFDKAQIPGTWEIRDFGTMALSYHTREFSLSTSLFSKFTGPKPDGYIFTVTPPRAGTPPPFVEQAIRFHYWNFESGIINLPPDENSKDPRYLLWNFESGDQCSPRLLAKILKILKICEPKSIVTLSVKPTVLPKCSSGCDYFRKTGRLPGIGKIEISGNHEYIKLYKEKNKTGVHLFFTAPGIKNRPDEIILKNGDSVTLGDGHHLFYVFRFLGFDNHSKKIKIEFTERFDARAFGGKLQKNTTTISLLAYN